MMNREDFLSFSASYVVPVEEALQRLNLALERIDGGTRAGRIRSVQ